MALRFASLGSGSKGNATLVEADNTCVMIDCGFSVRETETRLQRLGHHAEQIAAILVTHEHGDHVRGVSRFSRKYQIPVMMTQGTWNACQQREEYPFLELFSSHEGFAVDGLLVDPFPVPHDAREPAQFVFSDGNCRLGVLTDTGTITRHIIEMLDGVDALLLESNHDHDMLMNGHYPEHLKARVGGRNGHLSNDQSAELLKQLNTDGLQHLVAAHLSEKNNHPDHVLQAFVDALDCDIDWLRVADQHQGLDWLSITG